MKNRICAMLFALALAMLGSNAVSMPPVISNIKDIIVSDTPPSGSNLFVHVHRATF